MSTNPNQRQQEIDELEAYYDAINNANEANKAFGNLAPQDKTVVYCANNPSPYTCCPGGVYIPNPPEGSLYLAVVSGSSLLFWSYVDDNQLGFNLERSVDGLVYVPYDTIIVPSARLHIDHNVTESNTYWYRMNAYNSDGTSSWSNTASIYFPTTPPPGPISLSLDSGSALLSWSYTQVNELYGFTVEKSTNGSGYVLYATLPTASLRTHKDDSVFENNGYAYRVAAYNSAGSSPYSNTASLFFPLPAPYGPISLSLESGSAQLSWSYVDTTQEGFVFEKSTDGINYNFLAQFPFPNLRYWGDDTVTENNTYWYRIYAFNASGSSGYSNTASIYFPLPAPYGPISLSLSSGSANLNWTYTDTTQAGFEIYKSLDGGTYATYSSVGHPSSRSFADDIVQTGSTYWYRVAAYNNSGSSDNSNTASIYFDIPAPYGTISASVLSGSSIVSWSYVDHAQDGFNVAISSNGSPYSVSVQIPVWHSRSYLDSNVVNGNTYSYQVNAYNMAGTSSWSNTASIVFPFAGGPPTGPISLSLSSGSAILSWSYTNTNQDGFNIEYSMEGLTYLPMVTFAQPFSRSFVDPDVWESQEFWYRMNAYNIYGTSSYSNTASIYFAPPPPVPEAPLFLQVFSGSAILVWQSGSGTPPPSHWAVFKSIAGPSGSFTQIGISPGNSLTYHDEDVEQNRKYDYKVAAVGVTGTSSFSNTADIAVIACQGVDFTPVIYSGYVTNTDTALYKNIYGTRINFTMSNSQSISVWGRSPDFDVWLTLIDSQGNVLIENDWDGWVPSGDFNFGNAAFNYTVPSGSYTIEISSVNNALGRYLLYLSPGATKNTEWPNSYETATCEWIPTSNCVVVGEQGSNIMWYHVNSDSHSVITWPQGVQGIAYSPAQDRVFAWVYEGSWVVGWTASVAEYDNTGSYVGKTSYYRPLTVNSNGSTLSQTSNTIYLHPTGDITDFTTQAESGSRIWFNNQSTQGYITAIISALTASVNISQEIPYDPDFFDFGTEFQITRPQVTPNVDFSGYMTYDPKHDRIAFYRYFYATNHIFNIFDCATRTITASLNAAPYTSFYDMWEGCYSWADDCFYIGTTAYQKLVKVNATTFAITASNNAIKTKIISSYASSSGLLMLRTGTNPGKVVFANPVSESVVHTCTDLPSSGLFEGTGKSGDPADDCIGSYVITIDPRGGPNYPALALIDRNTFLPVNYITLNSDIPAGFAPDGWYQYSIAFNESNSRVYSAQVDYDTYTGRLYSVRCSRPLPVNYLPPYTASAVTASCMPFVGGFEITSSNPTGWADRLMPSYICVSTNQQKPVAVVSDNMYTLLDFSDHNWHNVFINTVTQQKIHDYTGSYIHNKQGKSALFSNNKFYMLDAVSSSQSYPDNPVNAVNLLVFDTSGSLLSTLPLSYNGRAFAMSTDSSGTSSIHVYEIDPATNRIYVESYNTIDDSTYGPNQFNDYNGGSPIYNITGSITQSQSPAVSSGFEYTFGKIHAAETLNGQMWYVNNINSGSSGFAGDTLTQAYSGWIHYSPSTNGQLNFANSPHLGLTGQWAGVMCHNPLNDRLYVGAYASSSYHDDMGGWYDYSKPVIVETNNALNVSYIYDLSPYTASSGYVQFGDIEFNRFNRTILALDWYNNQMFVIDPAAHTVVCNVDLTGSGVSGSARAGHLESYNLAIDGRGKVFVAQHRDGDIAISVSGSIKYLTTPY